MFPERPWTRTAPPPACTSCCATLMAAWPGPLYPLGARRSSWESGAFQGASYNLPADSSWLLAPITCLCDGHISSRHWGARTGASPKAQEGTCLTGGSGAAGSSDLVLELASLQPSGPSQGLCSTALGGDGGKSKPADSLLPCHFLYLTMPDRGAA